MKHDSIQINDENTCQIQKYHWGICHPFDRAPAPLEADFVYTDSHFPRLQQQAAGGLYLTESCGDPLTHWKFCDQFLAYGLLLRLNQERNSTGLVFPSTTALGSSSRRAMWFLAHICQRTFLKPLGICAFSIRTHTMKVVLRVARPRDSFYN